MSIGTWRDSLVSFLSGLGTFKDVTTSARYKFHELNRHELEKAYRGDWIARKAVDLPAKDATREWRQWQASGDQIEKIEEEERKHDIQRKMRMVLIRSRLYGGAALVLGVDDGKQPSEALDLKSVKEGGLKFVVVLNRYELNAGPRICNVDSPWYTRPEYYTVSTPMFGFGGEVGTIYPGSMPPAIGANNSGLVAAQRNEGQSGAASPPASPITQNEGDRTRQTTPPAGMVWVHPSRVIEFAGNELPDWRLATMGGGWGDSVLQTIDDSLKDFGVLSGSVAAMANDMKVDVVKIPNFSTHIASDQYRDRLLKRFAYANQSKSVINSIVLDKEEEWSRISTQFGGVADTVRQFMVIVSAAAGVAPSRLFGQMFSGLGGSGGEDELRNYYDDVASDQRTVYGPAMASLDQVLLISALGKLDPNIYYEWEPLWQDDASTKSTIALQKAQIANLDVTMGLINEDALRRARLNQLIEDGIYPGLEDAVDEFGEEPSVPMSRVWSPGIDPHTGKPIEAAPTGNDDESDDNLDQVADAFNPDQPRDSNGKWGSGGNSDGKSTVKAFMAKTGVNRIISKVTDPKNHEVVRGAIEFGLVHIYTYATGDFGAPSFDNIAMSAAETAIGGLSSKLGVSAIEAREKLSHIGHAMIDHYQHLRHADAIMDSVTDDRTLEVLKAFVAAIDRHGKVKDSAPAPLYVRRQVINSDVLRHWAKQQGFSSVVDETEMHVTIMYSRTPVDWMAMGQPPLTGTDETNWLTIPDGGPRVVEQFSEGAVVLSFASSVLEKRHYDMIALGAKDDYPRYQPHITITYNLNDVDLSKVTPYQGPIVLGPEIFSTIKSDYLPSED